MPRQRREVPWIEKHDNGTYYVFWYDPSDGRTKRRSLGTRDAVAATTAFGNFCAAGGPRPKHGRVDGLTVRQALADYLREHVEAMDDKGRPRVADQERQKTIIDHLTAYFGDFTDITAVGPIESRAYVAARRSGKIGGGKRRKTRVGSDSTIRRELNCLVAAFNHAVKWGRIPADSRSRVELPAEERGNEVKWLTKDQIAILIEEATGDVRDFILLAYYTGARRQSIEKLTKFQVDLEHSRINLMPPGARLTKKRKPIVPIYHEIRPTIERLMAREGEWLFGPNVDFYRAFTETAHTALQIADVWPHMLRHSRATHLLQDGESIFKVAKLLGDTVATVERVYGHSDPEFLMTKGASNA